jgi:plasmid maintenance system antidote protein VapI
MRLKKRHAFGERAGHAKLSSEEVGEIRFIWNNYAVLQKTLARGFGVGPNTISRIVHGVRRSLG